jgi:nitrilase
MKNNSFKVAAVQASPVFLNRNATIKKACNLIKKAGENRAKIIVFPEAFIPCYPDWIWVVPPGKGKMHGELYAELLENAITIPDKNTDLLCKAAKQAKAYVVIGINERNAEASNATMYNTILYIDANGNILGKHRKLVPTGGERLVWAQGDGSTLSTFDTPFGKLGGLICWENYMPLARYAMYAWGTQIYVAPTWDSGDSWLSTLKHIAKEGGIFVIGCCIAMQKENIPDKYEFKKLYAPDKEWINKGDSVIIDPNGKILSGPLNSKEGILFAEIDTTSMWAPKWILDTAGHYSRPDVFQLTINTAPNEMIKSKPNNRSSNQK